MAAGGARRTAALRVLLLLLAATLSAPLALGDDDERLPGWLGEVARLRGGGEGGIIVGRGQQPDPPPAPPVAGLPPLNSVHTDPAAITQVSWAPRAWLYKGFLKPAECGYMIRLATPSMQKSTVVDVSTGKSVPSQIRTSSGTFLRRYHDDVIEDIERRLAEYAMVPADNGEGLQILKYNFGEKCACRAKGVNERAHDLLGGVLTRCPRRRGTLRLCAVAAATASGSPLAG